MALKVFCTKMKTQSFSFTGIPGHRGQMSAELEKVKQERAAGVGVKRVVPLLPTEDRTGAGAIA